MEERISGGIEQHFGEVEDPRVDRTKLHKLVDILVIAICAVIYFKRGRIALFGSVETLGSEGNPEPFCG